MKPSAPANEANAKTNADIELQRRMINIRYKALQKQIASNDDPYMISRKGELLQDSIDELNRNLKANGIDPSTIKEAQKFSIDNIDSYLSVPGPTKNVDNSDIPVVPEYLANPKPYAKPKALDLSASDLMKVDSKTPIMMQGVQGARPSIKKPEDNKEHDPQQDVEEDEAKEFDQPTKGDGTNLKALQDRYISLYSPWDPDFDGLRTETKERFLAMAKEFYETTGNKIQVNSAFRSMKKQQELYDNRHNNSNPVAAPGGSIHNYGMALGYSI